MDIKIIINRIERDIEYWYKFGIHSEQEVNWVKGNIYALERYKSEGFIDEKKADGLISKGEDTIERYYSYLEETASLGNNWW